MRSLFVLVPPAEALSGEKVVEVNSPSPGRRDTFMHLHGNMDIINGEPSGASWKL